MCKNEIDTPLNPKPITIDNTKISDTEFYSKELNLNTEEGRKTFFKIKTYYIFMGLLIVLTVLLIIDYCTRAILVKDIFDLFKALLFSLSGYLFGKNSDN
ncbi:hypothetical protein [Streptobacillus moniliformis]|uniref:hypothetical protein n=1 Tax=Streptobacillus moniliformis TaxID=34105 RepID=UPI0007E2E6B3|nr:hypothetical protein [Streptobacillus moniliformis]